MPLSHTHLPSLKQAVPVSLWSPRNASNDHAAEVSAAVPMLLAVLFVSLAETRLLRLGLRFLGLEGRTAKREGGRLGFQKAASELHQHLE